MNARVPSLTVAFFDKVERDRQAWMFVGAAFQKPSVHCETCSYCEHKGQMVGFDEGSGYDAWQECGLSAFRGDKPEDCPAYQAHLQELEENEE
jgi:hypothetical protein